MMTESERILLETYKDNIVGWRRANNKLEDKIKELEADKQELLTLTKHYESIILERNLFNG